MYDKMKNIFDEVNEKREKRGTEAAPASLFSTLLPTWTTL